VQCSAVQCGLSAQIWFPRLSASAPSLHCTALHYQCAALSMHCTTLHSGRVQAFNVKIDYTKKLEIVRFVLEANTFVLGQRYKFLVQNYWFLVLDLDDKG
jgi:hypothetical protein